MPSDIITVGRIHGLKMKLGKSIPPSTVLGSIATSRHSATPTRKLAESLILSAVVLRGLLSHAIMPVKMSTRPMARKK